MTTAKKNNYGGGSITQIQKGKYRIRYSVDGEVTSITISGSKRDAEEGLKRLKAESKKGIIKVKKEGMKNPKGRTSNRADFVKKDIITTTNGDSNIVKI